MSGPLKFGDADGEVCPTCRQLVGSQSEAGLRAALDSKTRYLEGFDTLKDGEWVRLDDVLAAPAAARSQPEAGLRELREANEALSRKVSEQNDLIERLVTPATPAAGLDAERLRSLIGDAVTIIDVADNRAMAADGPVSHVRDEMDDTEWRSLYVKLTEALALAARLAKEPTTDEVAACRSGCLVHNAVWFAGDARCAARLAKEPTTLDRPWSDAGGDEKERGEPDA